MAACHAAENPYSRKRKDHDIETAEDYVELVDRLIATKGEARAVDMAAQLGVTSVTVSKTIRRLVEAGYIRAEPYRAVFLTEKGRQLAAEVKNRHDTVVGFLVAIGVPPAVAAQDCEGMEHHISEVTLACMRRFVRQGEVR